MYVGINSGLGNILGDFFTNSSRHPVCMCSGPHSAHRPRAYHTTHSKLLLIVAKILFKFCHSSTHSQMAICTYIQRILYVLAAGCSGQRLRVRRSLVRIPPGCKGGLEFIHCISVACDPKCFVFAYLRTNR
jgi:hypothetical protein